jgi:hypothetical protein
MSVVEIFREAAQLSFGAGVIDDSGGRTSVFLPAASRQE